MRYEELKAKHQEKINNLPLYFAFGQRRKTLLNTLINQGRFNLSKEEMTSVINSAGLDERIRGEAMSLEDFARLTEKIYEIKNGR